VRFGDYVLDDPPHREREQAVRQPLEHAGQVDAAVRVQPPAGAQVEGNALHARTSGVAGTVSTSNPRPRARRRGLQYHAGAASATATAHSGPPKMCH
jgi:hypothetical protein